MITVRLNDMSFLMLLIFFLRCRRLRGRSVPFVSYILFFLLLVGHFGILCVVLAQK